MKQKITGNDIFFVIAFLIVGFDFYAIGKTIKTGTKEVYKHPNIVVKKTLSELILRDINDNKHRVYQHNLSAKEYFNINEGDTVYFYDMFNYNKDSVFLANKYQSALRTKQR